MSEGKIKAKAYSKGYSAGLKRRRKEENNLAMRNDRRTTLVAAIISTAMANNWGVKVDGKHKPHDLEQLEEMAVKSADRMVNQMSEF